MKSSYESDVVVWAQEQARMLRARQFSLLDIEHIAEEIEDVGKSEKRELRNRMSLLLAHLLKWQYQPERRGNSWRRTIKEQRKAILDCLDETPSLKPDMQDPQWRERVWADAISAVLKEVELDNLPENCPWFISEILQFEFYPDAARNN